MKANKGKIIRMIDKQSPEELDKWFEEEENIHKKFWIARGIVNSIKHKNTELYNKAKSFLDKHEQSYELFPPMIYQAYALCLLGDYTRNEDLMDQHHEVVKHCEGFCVMWKADDEQKFGHPSNLGRYTHLLFFDTLNHAIECGKELEKVGVDMDYVAISPRATPFKHQIPIYYHKGRFTF